jgi:serine/threonine protein kinase
MTAAPRHERLFDGLADDGDDEASGSRARFGPFSMSTDGIQSRARRLAQGRAPSRVGRYEIVTRIGGGGMAHVYLARALGSMQNGAGFERLAAVKVLHPHLADDQGFVDMFLHEARVAANIRHPNVVTILDLGIESGLLYNVMDYIEGDTLAAVQSTASALGKGVPLPIALRIAVDVLSGLHAAHELRDEQGELLNVVHRDVTPQNVMLGVDGTARLTDFGVARARGRLLATTHGMLKGKLSYMPPEQLEAAELDRRADVFAMGVTLWETLALRRLYPGRSTYELARRNARAPYRSLREFYPTLPPVIDEVCARALAHDPDARFPSAAAFADALEQHFGAMLATSRDVGALIAAVARDKIEREHDVLRATSRPVEAHAFERSSYALRASFSAEADRRAAEMLEPFEASMVALPLVPQRRLGPAGRAPTLPPSAFFPNASRPQYACEESVTRELPLDPDALAVEVPRPVSPAVLEHGGDAPFTHVALELGRWTPLQTPPSAAQRAAKRSPRALFCAVLLALALAALVIAARR